MIDYQLNRLNQEIGEKYLAILRGLEAKEKIFRERLELCQKAGLIDADTLCAAAAVRSEIKITLLKIKLYDIPFDATLRS